MNIDFDQLGKKLHAKLDSGIDQLKTAKSHLADLQKETADAIQAKLNAAKQALENKEHEAAAAKSKMEEFLGNKTAQTQAVVAEWKTSKNHKKLEKRADRAEIYAESCVEMALYYADTAQVAILEAVAARKDANDAG